MAYKKREWGLFGKCAKIGQKSCFYRVGLPAASCEIAASCKKPFVDIKNRMLKYKNAVEISLFRWHSSSI
jgi:hypothetical protein